MKYATSLLVTTLLLSACAQGQLSADESLTDSYRPDTPVIDRQTQNAAADELEKNHLPATEKLLQACLLTRDEIKAVFGPAK